MKYYSPYYESDWYLGDECNDAYEDDRANIFTDETDYSTELSIINHHKPMPSHHHTPDICDPKKDILKSQACVARCEAKLFCDLTERLSCEIRHTPCIARISCLVDIANSFLEASACKEKALAAVITSCAKEIKENDCCC